MFPATPDEVTSVSNTLKITSAGIGDIRSCNKRLIAYPISNIFADTVNLIYITRFLHLKSGITSYNLAQISVPLN